MSSFGTAIGSGGLNDASRWLRHAFCVRQAAVRWVFVAGQVDFERSTRSRELGLVRQARALLSIWKNRKKNIINIFLKTVFTF